MKRIKTVKGIAVFAGLAIFVLLICVIQIPTHNDWVAAPQKVQTEIDQTVENLAEEQDINISYRSYLTDEFTERTSFGGAGGMGNALLGSENATDFIETAQYNNLRIYYTYEKDKHRFIKKYWALESGGIHELRQVHIAPVPEFYDSYRPKEHSKDESTITFEKSVSGLLVLWIVAIIGSAIMGIIGYIIIYYPIAAIIYIKDEIDYHFR